MFKVLVLILCFFISTADARIFGAQDFTLDNGLKVYVVPKDNVNGIYIRLDVSNQIRCLVFGDSLKS